MGGVKVTAGVKVAARQAGDFCETSATNPAVMPTAEPITDSESACESGSRLCSVWHLCFCLQTTEREDRMRRGTGRG